MSDKAASQKANALSKRQRVERARYAKELKRFSGDAPVRLLTQSAFNQEWAAFFPAGVRRLESDQLSIAHSRAAQVQEEKALNPNDCRFRKKRKSRRIN
jgi:hypothetical protein